MRKKIGEVGDISDDSHWQIGQPYLVRTVTMIETGRLIKVTDKELVLEDAAWIPDAGRWSDSLKDPSNISEVEPYPDGVQVIIGRGAIISACPIPSAPRNRK